MHFRGYGDLAAAISRWEPQLPHYDLIVGVPRSGMLPALMLALQRNVPVVDLSSYLDSRSWGGGARYEPLAAFSGERRRRVLVLDDSADSGQALLRVRERVFGAGLGDLVEYAVVYISGRRAAAFVDHYAETVPRPRGFQWNLMHHPIIERSCFDIDGILCRDPRPEENDDGLEYRKFLCEAAPQFVPTVRIGHVVTGRLEKYRSETEEWLRRAGIEYGELHMLEGVTAQERREARIPPKFKARVYRETRSELFYESSRDEAHEIANLSGRAVYCTETWSMIYPGEKRAEASGAAAPPLRLRARGWILDVSGQLKRKLRG